MKILVPGEQLRHRHNGRFQSFSLFAEASLLGHVELCSKRTLLLSISEDIIILTSKYWEVLLAKITILIQILKSRLYKNITFP